MRISLQESLRKKRQLILAYGLVLIGVFLLLLFHYAFPSMINNFGSYKQLRPVEKRIGYGFLDEVYDYHSTLVSEFSRRPLTSFFIQSVHRYLGLARGTSFIVVEFFSLSLFGTSLWLLGVKLKLTHREAIFSVLLWFLSLTILFCFFASMFTYDEPLQYLFFYFFLFALSTKKRFLSSIFLFLSLLAKDSTLLLFPGIFIAGGHLFKVKKRDLFCIYGVALVLYVGWLAFYFLSNPTRIQETYVFSTTERVSLFAVNFQDKQYLIETLTLSVIPFLVPLLLFLLTDNKKEKRWSNYSHLFKASALSWLINTPIVILAARANEARNFALPLLFIWPILGVCLYPAIRVVAKTFSNFFSQASLIQWVSVSLISLFVLYQLAIFSFAIYQPTLALGFENGYHVYVFVTLIISYIGVLALIMSKLQPGLNTEKNTRRRTS